MTLALPTLIRACAASGLLLLAAAPSHAQQPAEIAFDVATSPLEDALRQIARRAGLEVAFDAAALRGKTAPAVHGSLSARQAFDRALEGSGLVAVISGNTVSVRAAAVLQSVTITGKKESDVPAPFAGGQVASGGRVGVLGDRNLFETPFNITSFTAQTIEDQQAQKVSDLVRLDPAVRVANTGSSYYGDFTVRGFRVTGDATLYDGVSGVYGQYGPQLLQAIERVEVIKGANTLLGGLTSGLNVGGLINLVPKRATDAPVTDFTLSYASDTRAGAHLDLGRRFGVDNQFGARLNLFGSTGETAFDDEHEKLSLFALALDFRGEKARAFIDVGRTNQQTRGMEGGLYLDPSLGLSIPPPPASRSNFVQPFTFSDVRTNYFVLRAEVDLRPDVMAYAVYGGSHNIYKQLLSYGNVTGDGGSIDEVFQHGIGSDFIRSWEAGVRAKVITGPVKHQLVFSAMSTQNHNSHAINQPEAQETVASNIYQPVRVALTPNSFPDVNDTPRLYGNLTPSEVLADTLSMFDDRLLLTLGIRHQRVASGNAYSYTDAYDESAYTPALAGLVKVNSIVSVYANYIQALQGGPTAPDNAVNHGQVFPPSKNKQYEAGAKFNFGSAGLTFDVYSIDQPSGLLDRATNVFSLVGKQRNRGVELSVFGELTKAIRLNGGFSFVDAKFVKTEDGLHEGERVAAVPRTNFTLSGEWDVPWASGLTGTAGIVTTGATWLDQGFTQRVASFTDAQLGVRYKTRVFERPVTLRANVANVFDRSCWIADVYGGFYKSAPRTVTASATVSF